MLGGHNSGMGSFLSEPWDLSMEVLLGGLVHIPDVQVHVQMDTTTHVSISAAPDITRPQSSFPKYPQKDSLRTCWMAQPLGLVLTEGSGL